MLRRGLLLCSGLGFFPVPFFQAWLIVPRYFYLKPGRDYWRYYFTMGYELQDVLGFIIYGILCIVSAIAWSIWRRSDFYFTLVLSVFTTPIIASAFMLVADTGRYCPTDKPGFYYPRLPPLPKMKINRKNTSMRKLKYPLAIALIILLLTNPSLKDFHDFNETTRDGRRKMNFFIFSVYEYDGDNYIGILKNFIHL
jgi:hypothetical protein